MTRKDMITSFVHLRVLGEQSARAHCFCKRFPVHVARAQIGWQPDRGEGGGGRRRRRGSFSAPVTIEVASVIDGRGSRTLEVGKLSTREFLVHLSYFCYVISYHSELENI